ncbi:hypothetical protein KJB29_18975 [Geobacter grbiciae]|nr:hypothetical protein [Geobacter grbiciae]
MTKPQEYEHLIGKGSPFGCNYQSADSYLLIATVSTIFAGVAFGIGFAFKNRIWSVSSRVMTILLMYIVNFEGQVQKLREALQHRASRSFVWFRLFRIGLPPTTFTISMKKQMIL